MTELAYLADMAAAYERRFSATVTALPPGAVVLDRTLFYPAGGGQPCDRGTLTGPGGEALPVVDVVKTGPSVLHRVGRGSGGRHGSLRVGAPVEGAIDWSRRHQHMRLHTAQHLVSARLFDEAGLATRRAVLNGDRGVIELERVWPADRPWPEFARNVEAALAEVHPVQVVHVARAAWETAQVRRSGLAAIPPQVDPVRVIEIEGLDRCPCGGTHVRSTGEIGRVELPPPDGARVTLRLVEPEPPTPPG